MSRLENRSLGERLRSAERCCTDLNRQIKSGDVLINRLSRILAAARPLDTDPEPASAHDPQAVAAAAHAFAERARTRLGAVAA